MAPVTSGDDLIARLAESGTGPDKLASGRAELARVWAAERRVAAAEEIAEAMAAAGAPEGTLAKCRQLMHTGDLAAPAPAAEPIEVTLRKHRAAQTAMAAPRVPAPAAPDDPADDADGLGGLKVAELREVAEREGVPLGKDEKKADIVAAIRLAREARAAA